MITGSYTPLVNDIDINCAKNRISQLFKVNISNIIHLGTGTYSFVFAINNNKVVKIFRNKKLFRNTHINDIEFFEPGAFREVIFNSMLNHPRISHYDMIGYDATLGIYKTGKRMKGTADLLMSKFNKNMFVIMLTDIISALKYIHSIGLVHSDVKPPNILYEYTSKNKLIFKLCDFNITQVSPCNKNMRYEYDVFATANYRNPYDKRDVSIDVYMLGSTLLNMCLGSPSHESLYDINMLRSKRDIVIEKTDQQCYNILEKMLAPQSKRVYFDRIYMMLADDTYQVNNDCDIDKESEIQHHELCRAAVTNDFFTKDPISLHELSTIIDHHILENKNNKNNKNTYETASNILSHIISINYAVNIELASFFAQSLCLYPNDLEMDEWIQESDHSKFTYKDLNIVALHMCTKDLIINYHLVTCNDCLTTIMKTMNLYNDDNDESADISSDADSISENYITIDKEFVIVKNNNISGKRKTIPNIILDNTTPDKILLESAIDNTNDADTEKDKSKPKVKAKPKPTLKVKPVKVKPVKVQPVKVQPVKVQPVKVQPAIKPKIAVKKSTTIAAVKRTRGTKLC